jgi:hypothetical protein
MKTQLIALASVATLALSGCATGTHSDANMLSRSHSMPPKGGYMPDKAMPQWSGDCSKEALDKMTPEHRAMCEKQKSAPKS